MACRCDDAPAWRPSSGSGWLVPPGKSDITETFVRAGIEGLRNTERGIRSELYTRTLHPVCGLEFG